MAKKRKKKTQVLENDYCVIAVVDGSESWEWLGSVSDDLDTAVQYAYVNHEDIILKIKEKFNQETIFLAILPRKVIDNSPWDIPKWLNKTKEIQLAKEYHNLEGRRLLLMQGKNCGFVFPLTPLFKADKE